MTGRVLSGYRHELVVTDRSRLSGHAWAVVVGAALAAVAVFWGGL